MDSLIAKKAYTKFFTRYVNFVNVFSSDLTFELPEYTRINDDII